MTRLGRSDSLRSDDSRAKVSFNRDVHVRRIGGRSDWARDMREAEEVLRKAHSVESIARFNSLPRNYTNRNNSQSTNNMSTLERKHGKQLSPILEADSPWDSMGRRRSSPLLDEPSPRIRRLIVNTEALSPLPDPTRTPPPRRRSAPSTTPAPAPLPPAPRKGRSLPDRVKSLFKKKKKDAENSDPLKGRYSQYNGTTNGYSLNTNMKTNETQENNKETWFKSLDRRLRKSNPKTPTKADKGSSSQEENTDSSWKRSKPLREKSLKKPLREKPLRFFGDTEDESDWATSRRPRSDLDAGYSSATSAKSVVYLHSPAGAGVRNGVAVVDIPGRLGRRSGSREDVARSRRSASREELSRLEPRHRTVSRSVSVLAPWRPRPASSGDDTDAPSGAGRRLVFTGPPLTREAVQRSASMYTREVRAPLYGRTRK